MNIHFEGDYLYLVGNVDFYLDESDYANDNIVPTTLQSKKQGIRTGVARVNLTSATIKIDPLLPDFGLSPRYWKDNSNNVLEKYKTRVNDIKISNNKLYL